MFAVEIYAAVRRFVFIEGNSRREAARVFGLSRDTIAKMCRYSAPPGYVRTKAPKRPKLGPLLPVIDAILETDKTAPPKQQHTAKRIFERLRDEHGFAGGYTVVKDYVRLARTRSREVFVPLAFFSASRNEEGRPVNTSFAQSSPHTLGSLQGNFCLVQPRPGNGFYVLISRDFAFRGSHIEVPVSCKF